MALQKCIIEADDLEGGIHKYQRHERNKRKRPEDENGVLFLICFFLLTYNRKIPKYQRIPFVGWV